MSVKTLTNVQAFVAHQTRTQSLTYSVGPISSPIAPEEQSVIQEGLGSFLEAENPLGCIRGVMWVVAFNIAVFLLGLMIWQSCKYL